MERVPLTKAEELSSLMSAIEAWDMGKVIESIGRMPSLLSLQDNEGYTPLMRSIQVQQIILARYILESQNCAACLSMKDYRRGQSALHLAVRELYTERAHGILKLFIRQGAVIDDTDDKGMTPFLLAAQHGKLQVMQLLHQHKANVHKQNTYDWTALHFAANNYDFEMASWLVSVGCSPDARNKRQQTPLSVLLNSTTDLGKVNNARYTTISMLIGVGCDVNVRDNHDGSTPLLRSVCQFKRFNNFKEIELLIDAGANLNTPNKNGVTPLWMSVFNGHFEVTKMLVSDGCNTNARSRGPKLVGGHMCVVYHYEDSVYPIEIAMEFAEFEMVNLLVSAGCYIPDIVMMEVHMESCHPDVQWLRTYNKMPHSLKHICRTKIRALLKHKIRSKVFHLGLPNTLGDFLLFEEINKCGG